MQKPTNSAAEQIVAMRSINADIETQIEALRAAQQRNLDTIAAFEEVATWEEVEEPVVVEPEPEPAVEETVEPVAEPLVEEVVPAEEVAPEPTQ